MNHTQAKKIRAAVETLKPEAVSLLQRLVRIPSENHPPHGDERAVQEFVRDWWREHGVESSLVYPADIPAFDAHPARLVEHDMAERPNVVVTLPGADGGRSLWVLAHADVMPAGPREAWTEDPFSGDIRDGFLYGRGAGDDKCGMAIAAMLPHLFDVSRCSLNGHGAILTFLLHLPPGSDETARKRDAENALRRMFLDSGQRMTVRWMSRFLKPSPALAKDHPLVHEWTSRNLRRTC